MPAAINKQTKQRVIQHWVSGDSRDKIAIDNSIGEGTVSGIVSDWKTGLEDSGCHDQRSTIQTSSIINELVHKTRQQLILMLLMNRFESHAPPLLYKMATN